MNSSRRALMPALLFVVFVLLTPRAHAAGPRQMERLGRGVVAVVQPDGSVFVGWRVLGTDPEEIAFNVYRATAGAEPVKLNDVPLRGPSHLVDPKPDLTKASAYTVRAIADGREESLSSPFTLPASAPARQYLSIPLRTPPGYAPNDASVGDLDGDGEYEIVLHQTGRGKDNSQKGETDPPIFQAYKLDGTLLWTINLGHNIREGAHYTQFMVYDLDGDGRAEMVCKTSDGTTDGAGKVIGDANARHANADGHVLKGPELLTVFDGRTGAALDTVKYVPARTNNQPESPDPAEYKALWGDGYGNRGERYLAAVAYLDGERPSVIMCRGYYTRTTLAAWDFSDGKLTPRWLFDTGPDKTHPYFGQGNHNLSVADVDDDGKDEIVYGGCVIDDDGKGLFSTGYGHGDAMHVGDLDPANPGLEMFRIQERFGDAGAHMVALATGKTLWKKPSVRAATSGGDRGEGPGRGVCFDIDPRYPGAASWTAGAGIEGVWDAKGNEIGRTKPASCNFAVWWDGDPLRELLDKNHISKWNWEKQTTDRVLTADGCSSNNGTKATPCLSADLFGDWREEVVWRTEDNNELRIYTTTIPTELRIHTLMHDPQYRLAIAWQNVAYNQPPHPSFHLGEGMQPPPRPRITTAQPKVAQR
jgi:rhamnogalacturonan endolyase